MRRFAIVVGLTAALVGVMAAPAAAQTITPPSYDWGEVDPKTSNSQPLAEFQLTAGLLPLNGTPAVISGDSAQFVVLEGFCDGSLNAGQSCIFRVRVGGTGSPTGAKSAIVGIANGPTATVSATFPGGTSSKGKKCKKKGKKKGKSAAAAKKKGCKKKGKK
jgi:hypothetical protein